MGCCWGPGGIGAGADAPPTFGGGWVRICGGGAAAVVLVIDETGGGCAIDVDGRFETAAIAAAAACPIVCAVWGVAEDAEAAMAACKRRVL